MQKIWFSLMLAGLATSSLASADELDREPPSKIGVDVTLGGGVTGFVGEEARDAASLGGAWEARVAVATRLPVTGEIAYVGSAQPIDALGVDDGAVLLGSAVEGDARLNLMDGAIQPYVLAGVGWTRFDVTNTDTNTSDVADQDDVVHLPLGLGLGYRYQGFLIDARAVYRATANNDLLGGSDERLDTWSAALRGGFEF
jgi:hypothetical protein